MNDSPTTETNTGPNKYWRNQCVLYLLGELSEQHTAEFERQLADSAELGVYLQEQANVISLLAIRMEPVQQVAIRSTAVPKLTGLAAVLAAVAAGVVAIIAWQPNRSMDSESSMIALAWVDSQLHASDHLSMAATDDLLDDPSLNFVTSQSDSQIDETLDWMYTAISIEVGPGLGETNDG